jgi:hypothetical protein
MTSRRYFVEYTDAPSVDLDRRVAYFDRNRDPSRALLTAIDVDRLGLKVGGQYRCRATLVYGDGSEFSVETTMQVYEIDTEPGVPPYSIKLAITPMLDASEDFDRLVLTEFAPEGVSDEK